MSVDAHTRGRKLEGYRRHRIGDDLKILVDTDLQRLPVEVLVVAGGLLGRSLDVQIDGLNGAACPIQLV